MILSPRETEKIKTLVRRCFVHSDKADDAGMYTTGDTLWDAAHKLGTLAGISSDDVQAIRRTTLAGTRR
jgi:hypothetical protein